MSAPRRVMHGKQIVAAAISALLVGMVPLLGACAASGGASSAVTRIASPTPSPAVTVRLAARQSGSIAERDLVLTVAITVENHTSQPVSLYGSCQRQAILISLTPQGSSQPPLQLGDGDSCPIVTGGDLRPATPANSAHTYTQTLALFSFSPDWTPGAYTMRATIPAWSQPGATGLGGSASGETMITLT
ncbi:MAG TPA: hypothetical protein VF725_16215 [Ktedonobacterales bacterium]